MSERTAGTTQSGLAPKTPAKNRQMISVWMSFEVAVAIEKSELPKTPTMSGQRRPIISEPGAHINGPVAKPNTKRATPSFQTSSPTEKSLLACAAPAAKHALSKVAANVP